MTTARGASMSLNCTTRRLRYRRRRGHWPHGYAGPYRLRVETAIERLIKAELASVLAERDRLRRRIKRLKLKARTNL